MYCAPLRLLAQETWNRLQADSIACDLVTGEMQVRQGVRNFGQQRLLSCTAEMADLKNPWDLVVMDEAQLMADCQRGWAFTDVLCSIHYFFLLRQRCKPSG